MIPSVLEKAVAQHPFVRGMTGAHLRLLADCAMFTRFDAGQMIFHEGEIANRFYLIEKGKVTIETRGGEGEMIVVQTLGPGEVLGWSWLYAPYYWHFSACAAEATQAIFFYGTRLRERCEEDREFGFQLMRRVTAILMQRLQVTVQETVRLAGGSLPPGSP